MKKQTTFFIALLLATFTGKVFGGGPTAPYRFDSTFAQNGFLIDTLTGSPASYVQYNEILVGNNQDFWVAGVTNGTFLANKYSVNGTQLLSKTGMNYPPYSTTAGAYTGVISNNKFYMGGQSGNGGHYQNFAFNFDGSTNPIFDYSSQPDSFMTEPLYGPQYPVGAANPNCSDILSNGHVVTALQNFTGDSLYISEFNPTTNVTVMVYPKIAVGVGPMRPKALRTIPGTNNYALLVYNTTGSSTVYIINNGAVTSSYFYAGVKYNAMIAVSATELLLGGDNLAFLNLTTGNTTATAASLTGVLHLTRDKQSGEIYAFTGGSLYALTPAGALDNSYNPDGMGNDFPYTYVQADYWMGADVNPNQVFYTDMEMQGSNILISGFTTTLNQHPVFIGYAGFVIKIKGKPGLCDNFSVQLDSVYGTSGCDWSAHVTLTGAFPINAFVHWSSGGSSSNSINASPYIPGGLCPEAYDIIFTDGNGCKDTIYFVTPPPCAAPVVNDPVNVTGSLCPGTPVTIGPATSTGGNLIYQWYKNGQSISGATSSAYYISSLDASSDNGAYTVAITNVCGSDTSLPYNLTAHNVPVPAFTANGNILTCTVSATNYQWYFNGVVIPNVNSNQYTATQTGEYKVEIITSNGCSALSSPQNITVVGIGETQNFPLFVYPNPAKEFLVVNCDEEIETVKIYNVIGEQVIFVKGLSTSLNVASLTNGIYTVKITTESGNQAVKKFVKE